MRHYDSHRHKRLMAASESALEDALVSESGRDSRIARTVLTDNQRYRVWEAKHAELLFPVAQESRKTPQIVALRRAKVRLIHRRAFFRYLRENAVHGQRRRDLFRIYHATLDFSDAVLAEHRQYELAVSSRISTDHIIDFMEDPLSTRLLDQYEKVFARYFAMKCYVACARDASCAALVLETMRDSERLLLRLRRYIETQEPAGMGGNFDQQELIARSGRYPVLNYLNA